MRVSEPEPKNIAANCNCLHDQSLQLGLHGQSPPARPSWTVSSSQAFMDSLLQPGLHGQSPPARPSWTVSSSQAFMDSLLQPGLHGQSPPARPSWTVSSSQAFMDSLLQPGLYGQSPPARPLLLFLESSAKNGCRGIFANRLEKRCTPGWTICCRQNQHAIHCALCSTV